MTDMISAEAVTVGLDDDRIKFFADRLLEVARIRAAAEPSDGESDKEDLASYAGEVVTLRRTVIALHAQLSDAKAAQAMDGQRLLRRGDVEGVCDSPDMCFDYGETVRCGPCAEKLAARIGVALNPHTHSNPEAMRLKRDRDRLAAANAALEAQVARLVGALSPVENMHSWTESAADGEAVIMTVGTVRKMRAALAEVQARDEGAKG